jgi:hypothetical protein
MKNLFLTILMIFMCYHLSTAQKASDVLEHGMRVNTDEKLFLQYDGKVLKFDLAKSLQDSSNPPDFITLGDSTIFLVSKNGVNAYLKPLNPLRYSYSTENKIVIDPINEAAAVAMGSIIDVLGIVDSLNKGKNIDREYKSKGCAKFDSLKKKVEDIQSNLSDSKKSQINEIFNKLRSLDFADETITISELDTIKTMITEIETYFKKSDSLITLAKTDVKNYNCDSPDVFTAQYIFNAILKELATQLEEQKKRLDHLQAVYNLAKKAQQTASIGGGDNGLRWCFKLDEVPSTEGKISNYTITIKESGYILSPKEEIVSIESKDALKRTVMIRKFQRFVPEVSAGIVFSFFKYNSYGTTSDSTGQQYVASPKENVVENINITAMVNWNLYSPDNPIHPLIQIGVGIHSGLPSVFVGGGLRFSNRSNNSVSRIRITGGLAIAWIEELDKLKVGDKVLGTADIDNDLKYSGFPKFSPYVGLQYKF